MPNHMLDMALPAGASALRDSATPRVNFGATAQDYGRYRAGFPQSFFKRLFADGWVHEGEAVLDLGTGTGTIARGLALRGCHATGLDSEQHLLTEAARLDREAATGVSYVEGRAEETGLPGRSFDLVTAGQCWHWFDRQRTVREVARVLKPGGRIVIAHFDWLAMRGNVVAMTEALINRYNPSWHLGNASGLYPPWLADVAEGGFERLETFSYDTEVAYTHEAWRGRIRASLASAPRCLRRRSPASTTSSPASSRRAGRRNRFACRTASGRSRRSGRADPARAGAVAPSRANKPYRDLRYLRPAHGVRVLANSIV